MTCKQGCDVWFWNTAPSEPLKSSMSVDSLTMPNCKSLERGRGVRKNPPVVRLPFWLAGRKRVLRKNALPTYSSRAFFETCWFAPCCCSNNLMGMA